jgi:lysyl-tRNA synthetase class 2
LRLKFLEINMLKELKENRIKKIKELKGKGIEPYPHNYLPVIQISELLSDWQDKRETKIAGRIIAVREHGKSIFLDLKDFTSNVQVYLRKDIIGESNFDIFKNYIDIGDIVGFEGECFKTKTGEPTVLAKRFKLLSKSLLPLPEKWHGLKDIELRYRKRYLDLIMNTQVKEVFILRSKIINLIRNFLQTKGFLEVETPMLHLIPGGAAGKPFETHLDIYNLELYLRIAPELCLKRLLVGGFDKIYEINRSFRNEGVSTRHNPEFTMLELYWAYADYNDIMKLVEELFLYLAKELKGASKFSYLDKDIDLTPPWERKSFAKLLGIDENIDLNQLRQRLEAKLGEKLERLSRSQILKACEESFGDEVGFNPVFLIDHLKELSPLAKSKKDNPNLVERFELFIAGMEIANAYSELNDPLEQRKRFKEQAEQFKDKKIDFDFLEALEYGMPPAGGLGIGIDRLVMIFSNSASIREVIFFPLLKPEEK